MNTKQFVTKIISTSQNQLIQRIKMLPKLLSVGLISILGLLPLASISARGVTAYAQLTQQQQGQIQTTDPWYQSLEISHSKVQAALSPGAFGHGVPALYNLTTTDILMAFGMAVLVGIVVYMAVRALLKHTYKEKMGKASLLNKMI
jgi:hypothetical protein